MKQVVKLFGVLLCCMALVISVLFSNMLLAVIDFIVVMYLYKKGYILENAEKEKNVKGDTACKHY